MYDPTNPVAQSQGSQNDLSLWPTLAAWSNDPNDSGVYAATTPWYAVHHTINTHPAVVALPAGPNNVAGLIVYEITTNHPQYNQFRNRNNPNFASCPNKLNILLAHGPNQLTPNQLTVTII